MYFGKRGGAGKPQLAGTSPSRPAVAATGTSVPFQVAGNLNIRNVTKEATFDATVTPVSTDRIQGSATATIRSADWGLSIPQVPMVAGVADTVQLQLTFVATQ